MKKVQEKIELTGWTFTQVAWNNEENKYVDVA